ncbi:MAG: VanZ family protein [Chloroflexi bacterium]|nr:VanZ family protein [Chloroflexota bacterium]
MTRASARSVVVTFGRTWGPALAWMILIFVWSAQTQPPFVPGGDGWAYLSRKLGHFTEFAILAALLRRATRPRAGWLAFALASVYAASDEWHQSFVPGRDMLFTDWVIDSAGALVALAGAPWLEKIVRRNFPSYFYKEAACSRNSKSS